MWNRTLCQKQRQGHGWQCDTLLPNIKFLESNVLFTAQLEMHLGLQSSYVDCLANMLSAWESNGCGGCKGWMLLQVLPMGQIAWRLEQAGSWWVQVFLLTPPMNVLSECNVKGMCMERTCSLANMVSATDMDFILWTFMLTLPGTMLSFCYIQIQRFFTTSLHLIVLWPLVLTHSDEFNQLYLECNEFFHQGSSECGRTICKANMDWQVTIFFKIFPYRHECRTCESQI